MSLPHPDISIGAPPLLWSNVYEAFDKINANFDSLAASVLGGGGGGSVVDFGALYTDVTPATNNEYTIGELSYSWKSLYVTEWSSVPGNENNGVWLGTAQIKGITGGWVDLPANSTVNGDLIIDPNKTTFKFITVSGQDNIVAESFTDSLNLLAGSGITITTFPLTDTVQFTNSGVLSLAGTAGQIGVSAATGNITLTNLGVTSVTAGTVVAGRAAGTGVSVSAGIGDISVTNTGIIDVQQGFGITVFKDSVTGVVTVTNASPAPNVFGRVRVTGSSDLVADSTGDVLVVEAGYGMNITTAESPDDTLTIEFNNRVDIIGSVFADDSTLMVDATNGTIVAPVVANVTGDVTGNLTGNVTGNLTGNVTGNLAGNVTGNVTGDVNGSVYADDSTLLIDGTEGKIVGPVFANVTGNLTGNVIGDVTGNLYGIAYGDLIGSVFAEDSTTLVDATDGLIKGDVVNSSVTTDSIQDNSGVSSINLSGLAMQIGSTSNIEIFGAAGSQVYVGGGTGGSTSGDVYLGNGTNSVIAVSRIRGDVTGDLTGSIFSENSSLIIDAENNIHYGDFVGSLQGDVLGNVLADDSSVMVDITTRSFIGTLTGDVIGSVFADDSSVIIDGIGNNVVTNSVQAASTKLTIRGTKLNIAGGTPYVPSDSTGATGDEAGDVAFDSTSIYFCIADWASPGTADIWVKQDWSITGAW